MIVKKRLFPILVAILVVFALIPMRAQNVYAADAEGFMFQLNDDGTATLSKIDSSSIRENYIIPSEVEGHTVTSIWQYAFDVTGKSKIKSIEIPATVTNIGRDAFTGCSGLNSVTIQAGSKLEVIGPEAFYSCSSLKQFNVPASVKMLDYSCFNNSGLETITFDSGSELETISSRALASTNLKNITLPKSLKLIENNAFYKSAVASVSFETGSALESVKYEAFKECPNLKKITFPASVTSLERDCIIGSGVSSVSFEPGCGLTEIGDYVFEECPALKEVVIPAAVESIGNRAFCNDGITSLSFESGSKLQTIGVFAFKNNSNLKQISLPDGLKNIGYEAFAGTSISAVTIPDSVTNIDTGAFSCSPDLVIHYMGDEEHWNGVTKADNWTNSSEPVHFIVLTNEKATPDLDGGLLYACSTPGCHVRGEIIDKISRPAAFKLNPASYTYDGTAKKPKLVSVEDADGNVIDAADYSVAYSNNVNAGKAAVIVTFDSDKYTGKKTLYFTIAKASNLLAVKAKTATVKYKKLKKKTQTLAVTKVIQCTKKVNDNKNYTLASAKKGKKNFKKYFKINKTTGKVTVKKGLSKGSYKVKVKIKALGNVNYNPSAVKAVTFTVKVK